MARRKPKKSNWNWNRDFEWKKGIGNQINGCYKCRKNIDVSEERYIWKNKKEALFAIYYYCLDCGEEKQQEVDIKADELLSELTKDLAIIKQKKKINSLDAKDKKKIGEIKMR